MGWGTIRRATRRVFVNSSEYNLPVAVSALSATCQVDALLPHATHGTLPGWAAR